MAVIDLDVDATLLVQEGASERPLNVDDFKTGATGGSTEATLQSALARLDLLAGTTDVDNLIAMVATEATLAAIHTKLNDIATEVTQATIAATLTTIEGDVDGIEPALTTLNGKDFATQAELVAMRAVLDQIATNTGTAAVEVAALELTADQVNLNTDQLEALLTTLNAKDFATHAAQVTAQATFDAINTKLGGTLTADITDRAGRLLGIVTGPLTDTQLRASAVPTTGPLTDTQLRATAVPVDTELTAPVVLDDAGDNTVAVPRVGSRGLLWDDGAGAWRRDRTAPGASTGMTGVAGDSKYVIGSLTNIGDTVTIDTLAYAGLSMEQNWHNAVSANIVFEASNDGVNWYVADATLVNGDTAQNVSATFNGPLLYTAPIPHRYFRCRLSALASGGPIDIAFLAKANAPAIARTRAFVQNVGGTSLNVTQAITPGDGQGNAAGALVTDNMGYNGTTWERLRSGAALADAMAALGLLGVVPMGWNGTNYDRLNVDAGKRLQVLTRGSDGQGDAKGAASGFTNGVPHLYNGSSWDQQRANIALVTALAVAARTATTSSADQTNNNARSLQVFLGVTAASGTGGLQLVIESGRGDGTYAALNATPTAVTANGTYVYEVALGAGAASGGVTQRTSGVVPRSFRVRVIHGDASSYTYFVTYNLVV